MSLGRGADSGAGGGFAGGCWSKVGSSSSLLLLCSSLLLFQASLSSSLWLPLLLLSTKLSYLCSSFVEMLVVAAWEMAWMVVGGWGIPVTAIVLSSLQRLLLFCFWPSPLSLLKSFTSRPLFWFLSSLYSHNTSSHFKLPSPFSFFLKNNSLPSSPFCSVSLSFLSSPSPLRFSSLLWSLSIYREKME